MTDDRRAEVMRNGDSISRRSGCRDVSLPFLVNCFFLPECREMKVFRIQFRNKFTVPLLLNPLISRRLAPNIASSYKGVRPRYAILIHTHTLFPKGLYKVMLLPVAVTFT